MSNIKLKNINFPLINMTLLTNFSANNMPHLPHSPKHTKKSQSLIRMYISYLEDDAHR